MRPPYHAGTRCLPRNTQAHTQQRVAHCFRPHTVAVWPEAAQTDRPVAQWYAHKPGGAKYAADNCRCGSEHHCTAVTRESGAVSSSESAMSSERGATTVLAVAAATVMLASL